MLSTLKSASINTHPTIQQRQGALPIADIVSKDTAKDLIRIFEVAPKDPHFQEDAQQILKLYQPAFELGSKGCSVSSAFTAICSSLNFVKSDVLQVPTDEDFGMEQRFLFAVKNSSIAGFINASTFYTPEFRLCKTNVLGSYLPKVGRALLSLIAKNEKSSQFVADQMSDDMASHVMRNGKLRKLPPLSEYYKELGAIPYRLEGMDFPPEHPTRTLSTDKIQALSEQYLKNITLHSNPKSEPLSISGLCT